MRFDMGDIPAWVAFVPAAIAAGVAIRANSHAKKSAAASLDSAGSARRSADAAERQALAAEKAIPPPPPEVAWQLEPEGQARYSLRNTGTKTAERVEINANRRTGLTVRPDSFLEIPSGASVQLLLSVRWQGPRPNDLWVSWSGHPESVPVRIPRSQESS